MFRIEEKVVLQIFKQAFENKSFIVNIFFFITDWSLITGREG